MDLTSAWDDVAHVGAGGGGGGVGGPGGVVGLKPDNEIRTGEISRSFRTSVPVPVKSLFLFKLDFRRKAAEAFASKKVRNEIEKNISLFSLKFVARRRKFFFPAK